MRANGENSIGLPDQALWRQSMAIECVDDEAERILDLAAFADDRLDADDGERVAEWLARDPAAASDVAAARAVTAGVAEHIAPASEAVVARASMLVPGAAAAAPAEVIAFPARRERPQLRGMAQWGSLAAAVAVAAWLGFTLGIDTSRALVPNDRPVSTGFLSDLLDAQTGLVGDPGEAPQS